MMKAEELQANIRNEAEHHIPFGRDDVEIDYHVTNPMTPSGQTELLLVAAKKEVVSDYVQVVRDASLSPQVVDVAAFASQNGFEANYALDARETIVLINIGAAISNINIVRSGVSLFTRDVTIGGNAYTEEIQKQMGIAADEAEAYKVGGTQTEDGVVPQEVIRVMEGVSEVMAGEFQRSLDFFLATTADANVTRIVLAGGSAKVASLHRAIERRSRLPLEVADAWKRVKLRNPKPRTLAALKAVAAWREIEAQKRDLPRGRILRDEAMIELATHTPTSTAQLARTRGLPGGFADGKWGAAVIEALEAVMALPQDQLPKPEAHPDQPEVLRAVLFPGNIRDGAHRDGDIPSCKAIQHP